MKKLLLTFGLLLATPALAAGQNCFLAKENQTVIVQEGDCSTRHSPASSFKIALSLMGYNGGILTDETHPDWPFQEGYLDHMDNWKQSHTPALWMKHSCVWFSQVLTQKLGMRKFQDYVTKFHYGNQDVSGDRGQNNGLTRSWLSSSLEISPEEQLVFLQKLLDNQHPVSLHAHEMTRKILFVEELAEGWKLYGKTGSGNLLNPERTEKLDLKMGWFVGWIEKGDRRIAFTHYIQDDHAEEAYAGPRARDAAKETLMKMIHRMGNAELHSKSETLFDAARGRAIPITTYLSEKTKQNLHNAPIVILNHGYGMPNTDYSFLTNRLAAAGYFVASIQHDLNTDPPLPRTGDLFKRRKPLWDRGVQNILFVMSTLQDREPALNMKKVTLIGHSNGGDIAMLFGTLYPERVSKIISLDSLRVPFPTSGKFPILSFRAEDTKPDEGLLPPPTAQATLGMKIVAIAGAKHNDMCDHGPSKLQQEIERIVTEWMQ